MGKEVKNMAATSQEILKAAEAIEKETGRIRPEALPDPKQLCDTYNKIKGPLNVILPIIGFIPVYGAAVAGALKTLKGIADKLCPSA
jgi:hypothetical protein